MVDGRTVEDYNDALKQRKRRSWHDHIVYHRNGRSDRKARGIDVQRHLGTDQDDPVRRRPSGHPGCAVHRGADGLRRPAADPCAAGRISAAAFRHLRKRLPRSAWDAAARLS